MASILSPKLEIGLGLNKLGLDKGLKGAKSDLQGLDKSVKSSTGLLGRMGKVFTGIFSKGLGVAAGLGIFRMVQKIGGALEDLASQALDFNEEMANVASISHVSEKAMAGVTDQVLLLAEDKRIVDMPKILAAGLYDIVSAGFDAADALTVLEAAAIAATAGRTTTDVSARVISGILNAYSMDASHATEVSNQLFKIVDKGVVTFSELSNVIGYVLPTAEALGISLNEVGAAFISMTRQGIDASRASTNLSGILSGFLKPTGEMPALIESLGFESGAAMVEILGLTGAIQAVYDATGGDAGKAAELFGDVRANRGILALINDEGALYTEGLHDMEHAQDGAGATAIALKEQMKSVRFQLRLLHKNVVLFFTEGLGQKSMKRVAAFIATFNRFFDRLFKLRREFNSMKAFMLSFHTLLNQLFGSNFGGALFEAFRELIRIIHIFKIMAQGDWDRAWRHIRRVGRDAEKFLRWLWGTIKDIFNSIDWQKVGDTLWTGMKLSWNFVEDKTTNWLYPKLKKLVSDAWDAVPWTDIGNTIWGGTKIAYRWMTKTALPWLKTSTNTMLKKAWEGINWDSVGAGLWEGLKTYLSTLKDKPELLAIGPAIGSLITFGPIGGILAGAIALGLIANRDIIGEALGSAISFGMDEVTVTVGGIDWTGIGQSMLSGIGELFAVIRDWISQNPEAIAAGFVTAFVKIPFYIGEHFSEIVTTIILGLTNEIIKHPKEFAEAFAAVVILAIALPIFAIAVPFLIVGSLVAGIVKGIWDKKSDIADTGRNMLSFIWEGFSGLILWFQGQIHSEFLARVILTFQTAWPDLYNVGTYLMNGLYRGLEWGWYNLIKPTIEWIADHIPGPIKKILGIGSPSKVFQGFGRNIVQGLKLGIASELPSLADQMKKMNDIASGETRTSLSGTFSSVNPIATQAALAGTSTGHTSHHHHHWGRDAIRIVSDDPEKIGRELAARWERIADTIELSRA